MEAGLQESVEISLPKGVCLVVFELLAKSYERWREVNPDDASANPMVVEASHPAQRMAIWQLEGAFERALPELFSGNYRELLAESERLIARGTGT
jgi:hypothetical protein